MARRSLLTTALAAAAQSPDPVRKRGLVGMTAAATRLLPGGRRRAVAESRP